MLSQENVGVNISINGKWDYTIDLWAPSIMHFKKYYSFQILNVTGEIVMDLPIKNNKEILVQVSSLPVGVYIVQIKGDHIRRKRFIKE